MMINSSNTSSIQAVDVHGHYGIYLGQVPLQQHMHKSGDANTVVGRALQANIELTVVSPLLALLPRGQADSVAGNIEATHIIPQTPGLAMWVVVNPLQPATYEQARQLVDQAWCLGIKIHPEEHLYCIRDHGKTIFEFAARHDAVVLTHSGEANSMPEDFIPFVDSHPNIKLILAHIGCSCDDDIFHQMRAIQQSKKGNVYADTSSASSILPEMIEHVVREVGADRVLFGSDTPLYHVAMQRTRIDMADLSDSEKFLILRGNAVRLLSLDDYLT